MKKERSIEKMYLVVLAHDMDDLPLAIFADRNQAIDYALKIKPMPATRKVEDIIGRSCNTPNHIGLATFDNGRLAEYETLRDLIEYA